MENRLTCKSFKKNETQYIKCIYLTYVNIHYASEMIKLYSVFAGITIQVKLQVRISVFKLSGMDCILFTLTFNCKKKKKMQFFLFTLLFKDSKCFFSLFVCLF